jgi:hypothetical protein
LTSETGEHAGETLREESMLKNTVRSVLGLVLVAAATWLANYITEQLFGPEDTSVRA